MKFTPKTDEQIEREGLLEPGVYDFEVMEAKDSVSKKGNAMISVKLRIFSDRGERHVYDYLLEAMAFKLKHICEIAGADYEAGEVSASDLENCAGKVEIEIQEGSGGYKAKNVVVDYLSPKKMQENMISPAQTRNAITEAPKFADDDIPF